MSNTVLSAASLSGAATSPWKRLKNAEITFVRVLNESIDESTGNPAPGDTQTLRVPAFFKKAELVRDEGRGVPVGTYRVSGYTVGILPAWAENPTNPDLLCTVDNLGTGKFCFEGKIHVAKNLVQEKGKGSQIQGYFTLEGGL